MPFFALGRPYAYFVESQNQKLLNPFTLITDNERIVVDEHHPWMVETVHE